MKERMKKVMALTMASAMMLGGTMTTLAAEGDSSANAEVDAPIYSYDVLNVIVPTTLTAALNPEEYDITVGDNAGTPITDDSKVVSLNYGIVNLSTKDKVVEVDITATDSNDMITFVGAAADLETAEADDFAMLLNVVPGAVTKGADGAALAVSYDTSTDTATSNVNATNLANVEMTEDATKAVAVADGSAKIGFKLAAATYVQDGELEVGVTGETLSATDLASIFKVSGINATNGVAGFTLDGDMAEADWSTLSGSTVNIGVVYTFSDVSDALADADYGVVTLVSPADFACTEIGKIDVTVGSGDDAFASLVSVTAPWNGSPYAITDKCTVSEDKTTITIDTSCLAGWAGKSENPTATITYTTVGGDTKTDTVTLLTYVAE